MACQQQNARSQERLHEKGDREFGDLLPTGRGQAGAAYKWRHRSVDQRIDWEQQQTLPYAVPSLWLAIPPRDAETLPHIIRGDRWLTQTNRPRHLPAASRIDRSKITRMEQCADYYGQQD